MSDNKPKEKRNIWRVILAWGLIGLGIAGIFLPILPGWPFFFLGLFILAGNDTTKEKIINLFPKKFRPIVRKYFDAVYENQRNKTKLQDRKRAQKLRK